MLHSFAAWLVLNIVFFCTIYPNHIHTFFDTSSGPQYSCERFLSSEDEEGKFGCAFGRRISYTKKIHREVKE